MKKYIANKVTFVSIIFVLFVSAGIYFVDSKLSAPLSPNKSVLPSTTAEDNITAHLPKKVEHAVKPLKVGPVGTDSLTDEVQVRGKQGVENVGNNSKPHAQEDPNSDKYENIAMTEALDQSQPTEFDLSLPPPSNDNVTSDSTGEYADEINQSAIIDQATNEGNPPPEVDPDSDPPTGQNIVSEPQGEDSEEVIQQDIIDTAISEGYPPPEVDPDSDPPTSQNIASEPQGENSEVVIQ